MMWRKYMRNPEWEVDRLDNQQDIELTTYEANTLLRGGGYVEAFGLYLGRHYRRQRGEGCYHLRIDGNRAWLHWDRWDPRRFSLEHFFETPMLWGPAAALGLLAIMGVAKASSREQESRY